MLKIARQSILYVAFSTVLAGFSAGAIMRYTDPASAGPTTYAFLYTSIFLGVVGIFTLLGLLLRTFFGSSVYIVNFSHSFRQAILAGLLVIALLVLSSQGILYWWVAASVMLFLLVLEIFLNLKS